MRKVVVFVAVSLDGFLADAEGKVDWIRGEEEGTSDGGIYSSFIRSVDTVIMGYRTYHQIVCELSPEMWVYAGMRSYVVTHREIPSTREIAFTHQDPCDLVRMLKQQPGNDIWVCGGADLGPPADGRRLYRSVASFRDSRCSRQWDSSVFLNEYPA